MKAFSTTMIFCIVLLTSNFIKAQPSCKVLMDGIDQSYEGDCKSNKAHGYGTAEGTLGIYTGEFKKGRPDGKGKLQFRTGSYYEGEWSRGQKDGQGTFYFSKDSIITGFWNKDKYMGEYEKPYEIISKRGTARYTFLKVNDAQSKIELVFKKNGANDRSGVSNLYIQNDSGTQLNSTNGITIEQLVFPFTGKLTYSIQNDFQTGNQQQSLDFKIYEKGNWTIMVNY